MKALDISTEEYRQYEWKDPVSKEYVAHTGVRPQRLYIGRSTHRVVDSKGVTHLVPSIGQMGCTVEFKADPEVSF